MTTVAFLESFNRRAELSEIGIVVAHGTSRPGSLNSAARDSIALVPVTLFQWAIGDFAICQ